MLITPDQAAEFDRKGYLLCPDVFSPKEVQAMLVAAEESQRVSAHTHIGEDSSGNKTGISIWYEIGEDIWGRVSTCPRITNTIRMLLREEIAFFHGKVMLKTPQTGGAWEWHQDYGYWYAYEQFVYPRMISAFVAMDPCRRENGCLQVLSGSHHLGRIDHVAQNTQTVADPERVKKLEPLFEKVYVEMEPGSVLFFHCNLLHHSEPNRSENPRRTFIMCYSALGNPRLTEAPPMKPCPSGTDQLLEL